MRVLLASLLLATCSAHAALQARDINLDGVVDAYFDPSWNITYLADANIAGTMGITDPPGELGQMYYGNAVSFGQSLDVFGVIGWRLPVTAISPECQYGLDTSNYAWCVGPAPIESELSRLVGQVHLFRNLRGMYFADAGPFPLFEDIGGTMQRFTNESNAFPFYAMYVRDGDVTAIPEPSTYALMFGGLVALILQRGLLRHTVTRTPCANSKTVRIWAC